MTEKEKILQEIANLQVQRKEMYDSAWRARTFTARDEGLARVKQVDLMITNLQWKLEYIEAKEAEKKYKAEHPEEVVEEEQSSEPAPEGTVESILEFFGE